MSYESQASGIVDHAFLQNLYEHGRGNYFLSGGVLTSADTDLETDYTAIEAIVAGTRISAAAGNVTHSAGDGSNPRSDMVVVNSSATVSIVEGTPTAESSSQTRPPLGTLPAGSLILSAVYVPASASTILDANIFDRRLLGIEGDLTVPDGGGFILGHTSQITEPLTAEAQILGVGTDASTLILGRWGASTLAPTVRFVKSRDPAIFDGTYAIVSDDDEIGQLVFYPDDGVDLSTIAAVFQAEVDDGSPAAGDIGMAFVWKQMAGGGGAIRETMRLDAAGLLTILNGMTTEGDIDLSDGGTVAQGAGSGKATGVTLDTHTGQITMDGAQLNDDTVVLFTVTNSNVAATDVIWAHRASAGTAGAYNVWVDSVGAGSFVIGVRNISGGNLSEQPVINFGVVGGSAT